MKRKIFAALLAVMMVVSMLPLSVMALDATIVKSGRHLLYVHNGVNNDVMKYTIEFPEGVNAPAVNFADYVGDVTLPGYTFNGWAFFHQDDTNDGVEQREVHKYHVDGVEQPYYPANYTINYAYKTDFIVLYAHNVANNYTIAFEDGVDGEEIAVPDAIPASYDRSVKLAAAPERTGYTFTGWEAKDGTVYDAEAEVVNLTAEDGATVTLTAQWEANVNKLTFVNTSGRVLAEFEVATDDVVENLNALLATKYQPDPAKYYLKSFKDENGTPYALGDSFTMPTKDAVLTVLDGRQPYTLTFVVDGVETTKPVKYSEEIEAPADPEKEGYTFAGWVDEDGNPVEIPATMPANDVKVIATWNIISYDFTCIVDGKENTTSYEYGAEVKAPADPEKEGYTFTGWDGEIPATMPANDVTVTAQWELTKYTITVKSAENGKVVAMVNGEEATTATIEDTVEFVVTPDEGYSLEKLNYYFDLDNGTGAGGGLTTDRSLDMKAGDLTVTPKFVANNYWLVIKENDTDEVLFSGDGFKVNELVKVEELFAVDPGYRVYKWMSENVVKGEYTMPASHVELKVDIVPITYTLNFDPNGGEDVFVTATTKNLKSVFYDTTVKMPATTRKGYTFLGWEDKDGKVYSVGDQCNEMSTKHGDQLYFTAQWELTDYNFSIKNNGEVLYTGVYNMGEKIDLVEAIEDKIPEGYMIDEWEAVAADGTYTMPASNASIWVTFKPITYTLQFNAGKDQGLFENGTRFFRVEKNIEDEEFTLAELLTEEATREGYNLIAWSFGGEKYTSDAKFTVADLLELVGEPEENKFKFTAVWGKNTYTITYVIDDAIYGIPYEYGAAVEVPADPTKTGYTFAGWDKEIPATMPAENLVITAKWTANKYIVKFDANGGAVAEESMVVTYDAKYGEFPEVTRAKADFYGWYTADGVKVTPETIVKIAGNHTLTARWDVPSENRTQRQAGIPKNMRSIEIDTTEGGKTNVASGNAAAVLGSTYKLTVTPDEGFEIDEVLVNGKEAKVNKNGKVSFVVKADTRVEVSFVEIED